MQAPLGCLEPVDLRTISLDETLDFTASDASHEKQRDPGRGSQSEPLRSHYFTKNILGTFLGLFCLFISR